MTCQLSCDGVSENKSNSVSIDVYSLKFKACKTIYPHKLVRPLMNFKVDSKSQLREVIHEITANELRISQFVADKPKRSDAKDCKGHSAWFPCEYCLAKGTKIEISGNLQAKKKLMDQLKLIEEKINDIQNQPCTSQSASNIENLVSLKEELNKSLNAMKRKTNILWPSSTLHCEHRTRQNILEIIEKIENEEILSLDEAKGILGRSVLFDIPSFNFIYDAPAEYLHLTCLGVIKRLVELTFKVSKNRPRITKRKLSPPTKFNKLMLQTKVLKECSRRARNLDFAVFKGEEFRNLILFFFPLVIECIEPEAKEIDLWLYIAYMLRSAVIPSEEFSNINIELVKQCCEKFYQIFESLFGIRNCSYNLHTFCCHLIDIRTHGPLTETSAFKFETFYGEMRRAFVPGTVSPLKQIMQNIFLKRALSKHVCENTIFISNYDTSLECNKLVYCFKNEKYVIYEISDVEDNVLTCHKIGQYPVTFPQTPNIPWSTVGVFKRGGTCSEVTTIHSSEISGKVFNVGKYLITCPINVINEK